LKQTLKRKEPTKVTNSKPEKLRVKQSSISKKREENKRKVTIKDVEP
jgi:hypothetical protein